MALLSIPTTPHHTLFAQRPRPSSSSSSYSNNSTTSWLHGPSAAVVRLPSSPRPIISLCASSSSSSSSSSATEEVAVEDDAPPRLSTDSLPVQSDSPNDDAVRLPLGGCKACGREEIEKGCNGEGRIQGGIATVPGFGWWPIKAYRPCPGFIASGGRYRRQGQSMDEVAFGRGKRGTPKATSTDVESRRKDEIQGKFKR